MFIAQKDEYFISTDPALLDLKTIHEFLTESYWGKGRDEATVQRSIENALNFGVYFQNEQIGFARVVSDRILIAYLMDVFILEAHRGKGLGKWLMKTILECDELKQVRRWILATKDAQDLYTQFGFKAFDPKDKTWMEKG